MEAILLRENLYRIEDEHVRCFLAIGNEKALLIDAGINAGLKSFIETLTNKPVQLVLTHADPDHFASASEFESVMMHPAEMAQFSSRNNTTMCLVSVWENEILEVGDFCFEIIQISGHTPGSIAFLERSKRFLISGDSVSLVPVFMFGNGRNLDAYRASLNKLRRLNSCFDVVFGSHGETEIEPSLIDELLELALRIKNDEIKGETVARFDHKVKIYQHKRAQIFFL